jgi:hypothetical protein
MADTPISGLDAATTPVTVPKKGGAVDPSILQNMQAMVDERAAPNAQNLIFGGPNYNSFMSGLKDAAAWASGGVHGPSAALAARDREKALEAKDLYEMRTQLATMKAAQERQKRAAEVLGLSAPQPTAAGAQPAFGGQTQPMAGTQPALGGAIQPAAGVAAQPSAVAPYQKMLSSLPEELQPLAKMALAEGDFESFGSIVKENTKSRPDLQKNFQFAQTLPADQKDIYLRTIQDKGYAPQSYIGDDGQEYKFTPQAAMPGGLKGLTPPPAVAAGPSQAPTAPSAGITNYGNIRPEGKSTGFQTYATPEEGLAAIDKNLQSYGKKGVNTLEGVISRWAPPNENDTPALIANASKRLGLDPKQPLDMENPAVRQAVGTAIMLQEHGNKIFAAPKTAAPVAAAQPAVEAPIAQPAVRKSTEQVAAEKAGETRRREKMAEGDVDTTKAIIEIGRTAGEKSTRLADASRIVNDPSMKDMFGVLERSGALGPITKFVAGGIQMGTLGSLKFGELEGALRNAGATDTQIANVARIETVLKQQELEYAKTYLKGQGSVSDNERKIVQQAIGSIHQPAEQLRLMVNIMQERANFDNKMYQEFNAYRKATKDPYASFEKFTIDSPAADRIINEHNQALAKTLKVDTGAFNDPFNKEIATRADKQTSGGVTYRKVQ